MPRNDLNAPNAASLATGGGQATNVYSGGVFELGPDEALLIEATVPVEPQYAGFHLPNLWGESLDFANHQSSLNGHQAKLDADGVFRAVVSQRDPGVANWLDTAGHSEGSMIYRWNQADSAPIPAARKVKLSELSRALPPGTARVSPAERAREIEIRRTHVRRRMARSL
jgi:hypothetical protein